MDEQNRPDYPGEEHHYSPPPYPQTGKITDSNPRSRDQRHKRILIGIIAGLLVVVIVLGFVVVHPWTTSSAPNSSIPVGLATPTAGTTPSQAGATLNATPTPNSSPGSKVLCESNVASNWSGWTIQLPWKLLNGTLLTENANSSTLTAPANCQPSTPDYAVEETVQVVQGGGRFGMIVRGGSIPGYTVGIDLGSGQTYIDSTQNLTHNYNNVPDTHQYHTYRVEVKGNVITFFSDGSLLLQVTDNTYLDPGKVMIFCAGLQLQATDFKVLAM